MAGHCHEPHLSACLFHVERVKLLVSGLDVLNRVLERPGERVLSAPSRSEPVLFRAGSSAVVV